MEPCSSSSGKGHWRRSRRRVRRQRGATVASSSSPASPGSARPRSSRASSRDLEPAPACFSAPATTSRSRGRSEPIHDLAGSSRRPWRRRWLRSVTARDPPPAPRRARASAAADRARARGRALGGRGDARRDHPARTPDRLAARAARAHVPRRRGAAGSSGARSGLGDLGGLSSSTPLSADAVASLSGDGADDFYAATGGNPFYVTELLGLAHGRRTAAFDRERRPRACLSAVRRRTPAGRARVGRAEPRRDVRPRRRPARLAGDGGGAGAAGAARGPPSLRALPPRARAQRDQVERPDRGAAAAPRRDPRGAARSRGRSGRHRPPRGGGRCRERRRRVRARRGPAGGGARLEPRGVLPLSTRIGVPRPTSRTRASRRARGAGERGVRGLPAGGRVRRDRALDRGVDRSARAGRRSAAARRSCRGSTGTQATAMPRGRRRSRRSRSSSRSASRSSLRVPTAASPSSRTSPSTTTRRSSGGSGRSSSRPSSATSAPGRTCWSTSAA